MIIRWAGPEDEAEWRRLWQGFLDYYQWSVEPGVTDFTWKRLMDQGCAMKARLAIDGECALGFAIHQHHPSTWVMGDDCYLEDLYVDPVARGQGIGRALIRDLTEYARSRGWKRLHWNTDLTNDTARLLYDSITPDDGHIRYRLVL